MIRKFDCFNAALARLDDRAEVATSGSAPDAAFCGRAYCALVQSTFLASFIPVGWPDLYNYAESQPLNFIDSFSLRRPEPLRPASP